MRLRGSRGRRVVDFVVETHDKQIALPLAGFKVGMIVLGTTAATAARGDCGTYVFREEHCRSDSRHTRLICRH